VYSNSQSVVPLRLIWLCMIFRMLTFLISEPLSGTKDDPVTDIYKTVYVLRKGVDGS
jgi:hypothetical protein